MDSIVVGLLVKEYQGEYLASRKFHTGWILAKTRFHNHFETKRLVDEFDRSSIEIKLID